MSFPSRSILDRDMLSLREKLLQMTSLVDTALDQAMTALATRDTRVAEQVIVSDEEINMLRFDVETLAQKTLATQQPAAGDLRLIIAAIHLAVELERMGDHASGIARLVRRMEGEPEIDTLHKLPQMAKRARRMIQDGMQAFLDGDVELARQMVQKDYKIDRHYNKLFRQALEEMKDETYLRRATFLLWVGHNLERIGDRATNIAERVIFMKTGSLVENIDEFDDIL